MLVLSRQRDETIMIGDDVEITIVDIRGDKVRLGINAPTTVAVHRKEVYEAIKQENEQASRLYDGDLSGIPRTPPPNPARVHTPKPAALAAKPQSPLGATAVTLGAPTKPGDAKHATEASRVPPSSSAR